ncbi:ribonuclease P protein subunit p30 [Achlya hypogyna]|uniref:Ribonuclease P protein subunit p30 n=1 Tax=Achlya hypogyna TaxID=1202772 RepID=A0A1V9Y5R0_ACHHY|nr:ribonuclease P protein subunit p30 [Achlya hypogyna]
MYWDLNVPSSSATGPAQSYFLAELSRLGYGVIALNVECDGKKAPPPPQKLAPWTIESGRKPKTQTQALRIGEPAVRQLKRITVQCEDMNGAHSINSNKAIQSYDIVAVEPGSQRIFQFFCEHGSVDIITLDMTARLGFQLRKPLIDEAIKRGIYFELKYTAALGDSSGRRYFFANATSLLRLTKGRHMIFASGATRDMLLRAPYDVINIGILLGLPFGRAKDAVSSSCAAVVAHGGTYIYVSLQEYSTPAC